MEKLLIVEDREEIRSQLRWGLAGCYETLSAANRQEALSLFKKHQPAVMTLDLGLPPDESGSTEGFRCLEEVLRMAPATKVIMITGSAEREHALRAVRDGACDYYCKPLEIPVLKVILQRAFNLAAIEREQARLFAVAEGQNHAPGGIIGQSAGMHEVYAAIRKVAASDASVLITGESGTGKELVAKAIHALSGRRQGPFIAINCGAIPENLIEAELFGYEKGAFSGAHSRVQGKVEYAHKGTLFLDEIGELPLNLQVKLLRFLQEKKLQRVGGREDIAVDTRIIAATNRNITKEAEEGSFREDLYYRISVVRISLPPLRERGGDIMLLAKAFLKRFAAENHKKMRGFSSEAVTLLETYEWPGNVRELENRVQRAVIMSDSPLVEPEALDFSLRAPPREALQAFSRLTLRDAREMIEREMILSAIESQKHNMAKAAEALGISRPTLYDLTRKHRIEKPVAPV
ncbi:PEP-CTERM-box response regulator transcription factor [Trichlorobacter ammonificans]|uniref:Regulatory protein AtoC n=1 Tax=Trichlorobacter ammonificans TaxID=2916410 RepID=A0ABN8HN03_9BACT|nr:PEP-CTERM-box response regulator transcription factor [Trichlorobacter ammonificans]CAH2031412.1 Regulatory protein AtoC [Trichlorobacter ammonificans]